MSECASATRLTPSQHVVPEELLLPYEDRHDDERVEVDALTQHPEVVGRGGVLVEQRQHLAADLKMDSSQGLMIEEQWNVFVDTARRDFEAY